MFDNIKKWVQTAVDTIDANLQTTSSSTNNVSMISGEIRKNSDPIESQIKNEIKNHMPFIITPNSSSTSNLDKLENLNNKRNDFFSISKSTQSLAQHSNLNESNENSFVFNNQTNFHINNRSVEAPLFLSPYNYISSSKSSSQFSSASNSGNTSKSGSYLSLDQDPSKLDMSHLSADEQRQIYLVLKRARNEQDMFMKFENKNETRTHSCHNQQSNSREINKSAHLLHLSVEANNEDLKMRNKSQTSSRLNQNQNNKNQLGFEQNNSNNLNDQKMNADKTKSENIRRCPHCNYCWRSHQSISSLNKCRRCEKGLDESSQENKTALFDESNNSNSTNITASQQNQTNELFSNTIKIKRKLPPIPSASEMSIAKPTSPTSGLNPLQFLTDLPMTSLFNSNHSKNFQEKSEKLSPSNENNTMLDNLNNLINKAFKSKETASTRPRLKPQKSISNQEFFPSLNKKHQHLQHQNALLTVDNDEPLVEINLNKNFYLRREQQLKNISSRRCSQSEQNLDNTEGDHYESIKRVLLYKNPKEAGSKCNEQGSSSRRPSIGLGLQISACQKLSELNDKESAAVISSIEPDGIIKKFNVSICEGDEIMQIDGVNLRNKSEQEIEHIIDESCHLNNGEIELIVRRRSISSNTSINFERRNSEQTNEYAYNSHETESESSHEMPDSNHSNMIKNMNSKFEHLKLESNKIEMSTEKNVTKHPNKLDLGKFRESHKRMQTWDITPTKSEQEPLFQQINKTKNEKTEVTANKLKNEKEYNTPMQDNKDYNAQTPIIEINKSTKKDVNFSSSCSKLLGEIEIQLSHSDEEKRLKVIVLRARNLVSKDANGFSDPFVKIYLLPGREQENKRRTRYISRTLNPEWNYTVFYPNIYREELQYKTLELTVWDWDRFKSNDFLGMIQIELNDLSLLDNNPHWYPLKNIHNEEVLAEHFQNETQDEPKSHLKRSSSERRSKHKK